MKNIFLLLLFSPFYFSSCTKDKGNIKNPLVPVGDTTFYTIVEGYCTDVNTGKPVSGVKISISWHLKNCHCLTPPTGIVDTFYSDSLGFYSYKFVANDSNIYGINGSKESECYYFAINGGGQIEIDKKVNGDMQSGARSTFNIHFKNTNPVNNNDKISIFASCWSVLNATGSGMDHTSSFTDYCGNQKIQIRWEVTKNNITTSFSDSVFIAPCIDTNYSIFY